MEIVASVEKKFLFEELKKTLEGKSYIFFGRFSRLSVNDFGEFRRKVEKVANRTLVVKNSLTRRALEEMGMKDACDLVKGAIVLTIGEKEPQAISKVLVDFAKGNESFQLAGACLDGSVFQAIYLEQLAKLPPREVLLASVVGGLNAPIQSFVSALGQIVQSLVIALDQVHKKKASAAS